MTITKTCLDWRDASHWSRPPDPPPTGCLGPRRGPVGTERQLNPPGREWPKGRRVRATAGRQRGEQLARDWLRAARVEVAPSPQPRAAR